jgi:eukaryotic-like serine/threonine-protein kinase
MSNRWDQLIARHLGPEALAPAIRTPIAAMLDEALSGGAATALTGGTAVPSATVASPVAAPAPVAAPGGQSNMTWDPAGAQAASPAHRYQREAVLGVGGMGEVLRARDAVLRRPVAMKVVGERVLNRPDWLARFVEEAQVTAQLEHPGIVPVHDLGHLPDGRLYYTMREVLGRSLEVHIRALHDASPPHQWAEPADGWTFRRLVDALCRACEAVAYAHARGVVHRDLKPANIMLGSFGEVLVVDWGLAKVLGSSSSDDLAPVVSERSLRDRLKTRIGQSAGTLDFMPPEQRAGRPEDIGPPTDVYALGVCLYVLLMGSAPPLEARERSALAAQLDAPPGLRRIPAELRRACLIALSLDVEDRHSHAGLLAADIQAWLDGARRREQARELVQRAAAHRPRMADCRHAARQLREQAATMLDQIPRNAPVAVKRAAWELQDRAAALEQEADQSELQFVQGVQGALNVFPGLPEAQGRLAEHYRRAHEEAEASGDAAAAARAEALLRAHDDGTHGVYLDGTGALSLRTDPPAAATLMRYVERDRRLVAEPVASLGTTPLTAVPLPMGSYIVELKAPGHAVTRYPVRILRGQHWGGPLDRVGNNQAVPLPPNRVLGPNDLYVPPGWFHSGGDPSANLPLPARALWLEGFVIQRFPVTNREFIVFLDDLVSQGREAEALLHVPREKPGRVGAIGAVIYGREPGGGFSVGADGDGDVWELDFPVIMIPFAAAVAYSEWLSARTGLAWRLPYELEWEKAARGVDGRTFPWGDYLDPTWAVTRELDPSNPALHAIGHCPEDEGPYGMRDAAGGVRDWCADPFLTDGQPTRDGRLLPYPAGSSDHMRADRGGSWSESARGCRVASRDCVGAVTPSPVRGFRLVRDWPPRPTPSP